MGVVEHQPAIAANCEVDPVTMKEVEEAIVAQKARCTPKQLKHYREAKESDDQSGTFLIRKAKVDVRSCPKWKRSEVDGTKADDPIRGGGPARHRPADVQQQKAYLPCV